MSARNVRQSEIRAKFSVGAADVAVAPLPDFYPALVAKIRSRLVPTSDGSGCLIWSGATNGDGYGYIGFAGRDYSTHRVMLQAKVGYLLPRNIETCHECDNPPCCADAHLWPGTRLDNMRDAAKKGRMRSPKLPLRKLSPEQVAELRAERAAHGTKLKDLGRKYGLATSTVHLIVIGQTYR